MVLAVNWVRAWRSLTLVAFTFTLVTGMSWALHHFTPAEFATTEAFLIVFTLLFSLAPILPALFRGPRPERWADVMLIFATPIAAALAQQWLLDHAAMAMSALRGAPSRRHLLQRALGAARARS